MKDKEGKQRTRIFMKTALEMYFALYIYSQMMQRNTEGEAV